MQKDLRSQILGEFKSIFETALDHESEDQLGTFGETTFNKKVSRYCPFKLTINNEISNIPDNSDNS